MTNTIAITTGKMELYRLISLGFHYPKILFFEEVKTGVYFNVFKHALEQSGIEFSEMNINSLSETLTFQGIEFEEFESQYLSDFEINSGSKCVSLCERHYYKENRNAETLLEIKEFYKNFDLRKSSEFEDSEDHLVLELEFMHFLIFKELQAIESGFDQEPYRKCRCDFLERHLVKWIPSLVKMVDKNSKSEFHIALSKVADKLVQADYNYCKEELYVV